MQHQKITKYISLLRPEQWYKNILIFIPLIFSENLINKQMFLLSIIGFLLFCILSSANYIINDIFDKKKDILHPEKKKRPIASGQISIVKAFIIALILYGTSLTFGFLISIQFLIIMVVFTISTFAYTLGLKNIIFLDNILISSNFVLRTLSGIFLLNVKMSYWVILVIFFLASYLVYTKRLGDLEIKKQKYKLVLFEYEKINLNSLIVGNMFMIFVLYSLYCISTQQLMIFTLPFVLHGIYRHYFLIQTNKQIARRTELIFMDSGILISLLLFILVTIYIIYFL